MRKEIAFLKRSQVSWKKCLAGSLLSAFIAQSTISFRFTEHHSDHLILVQQVRMAATLPAGILERMICLTESLLAALDNKSSDVQSTAAASSRNNHDEEIKTTQHDDVSGHHGMKSATMVFKSQTPADIKCNHGSNRAAPLRRGSGGSRSPGGAEKNKIRCEDSGNFESDTTCKPGQVMLHHFTLLQISTHSCLLFIHPEPLRNGIEDGSRDLNVQRLR
jgi:hypothetical protein